MTTTFTGIDPGELRRVLASGADHGGNPIEPFVADAHTWPLRCCLGESDAGDRIAIIAWRPFPWRGPYAEVSPIVVHVDGCSRAGIAARGVVGDRVDGCVDGRATVGLDRLPESLDRRPMVLRPYGPDRHIAYHRVRHVPEGGSLSRHADDLLAHDDVELVHGRNVTGGCYAFTATRADRE